MANARKARGICWGRATIHFVCRLMFGSNFGVHVYHHRVYNCIFKIPKAATDEHVK